MGPDPRCPGIAVSRHTGYYALAGEPSRKRVTSLPNGLIVIFTGPCAARAQVTGYAANIQWRIVIRLGAGGSRPEHFIISARLERVVRCTEWGGLRGGIRKKIVCIDMA